MFFRIAANLNDNDKARIELIAQRFQNHFDSRLLTLPIRSFSEISANCGKPPTAEYLVNIIAEHLGVSLAGIKFRNELKVLNKSGGGG